MAITQAELTEEFESNRSQLKSFILRMTASADDTEDLVQDSFIRAFEKMGSFRGESSVKTWIFSIATNLCKDFLRSKKLWPETVTDICRKEALSNQEFLGKMMEIRS